uniref:Gustatory receptor n=1 Tax=Stomoxys calcitrans TaxID=35570 RepID=A0A1I8PRC4_STOCA
MSQQPVQTILVQFSLLFLLCKLMGIYPQELRVYQRYHELKKSSVGTFFVIVIMLTVIVLYNFMIISFWEEDSTLKATQSTLTFVIGIFLTYIGLVMMATDQLSAIRNQKKLGELYERIRKVDERLYREGCILDNSVLEKRIRIMVILTFVFEFSIAISAYIAILDHTKLTSLLWMFSCLPTLFNSLDKIWFASTLYGLQQRFEVINEALNNMVKEHERYQSMIESANKGGDRNRDFIVNRKNMMNDFLSDFGHKDKIKTINKSPKELGGFTDKGVVLKIGKNRIKPVMVVAHSQNNFNQFSGEKPSLKSAIKSRYESELKNVSQVEEKLNNFCQIHDEICEIGKTLNELWSYAILVLMAYGFLIFTAQLYFFYCSTQDQVIPSLFLSAKNAFITATFLFYTAGKCVYLIYLSWRTSLESKRTGVCMHKCGVVADDNSLYEIINHLSLKLLNHSVDFSACGFFSLDMETLYGVAGGITSYLIILIQFNLAAQQAKDAVSSYSASGTSEVSPTDITENTTSLTTLITSTMTTMMISSTKP